MTTTRVEMLFPVGRMVMGSVYKGRATDADDKPLVYKTGPNAGQPRSDYFFALAIAKNPGETHWNQTAWGKQIWDLGQSEWPNGQANSPTFAWKIVDGDSAIPNKQGKKPCDRDGYPGNWVVSFNSTIAPRLYKVNAQGVVVLAPETDLFAVGDYIEVHGNFSSNAPSPSPGVYINHSMVCWRGYHPEGRIVAVAADTTPVEQVGFGKAAAPGATTVPQGSALSSSTPATIATMPTPPVPHPTILTPPAMHMMLPKAQGIAYDEYIKNGWNDAMLREHGMMA